MNVSKRTKLMKTNSSSCWSTCILLVIALPIDVLAVRSQERKFSEWAANDAKLLCEEIDAGAEQVVVRIVDHFGRRNLPGAIPLQLAGSE